MTSTDRHAADTRWLEILAARGLDVDALAAGDAAAEAELERHVAAIAEAAAAESARQEAWAGTQAAQLASLAAKGRAA